LTLPPLSQGGKLQTFCNFPEGGVTFEGGRPSTFPTAFRLQSSWSRIFSLSGTSLLVSLSSGFVGALFVVFRFCPNAFHVIRPLFMGFWSVSLFFFLPLFCWSIHPSPFKENYVSLCLPFFGGRNWSPLFVPAGSVSLSSCGCY